MQKIINVDNTLLTDFAACDSRGLARHALGYQSLDAKLEADVGNVFHEALEGHFSGENELQVMQRFEDTYERLITYPVEKEQYSEENVKKIMKRYVQTHPLDQMAFNVLEAEKTVGVVLSEDEDLRVVFWMKRDLLVEDKGTGATAPMDHKTTGNMTAWWARKFRMTSQMSGYCWGTAATTGRPCEGVYINGIEIKKVPNSKTKCKLHKVPFSECGLDHCKSELFYYSRDKGMLERWKRDAVALAKRYAWMSEAVVGSPVLMEHSATNGAFTDGCTFCEFKKWCVVGFKKELVGGLVTYNPWTPWDGGEIRG